MPLTLVLGPACSGKGDRLLDRFQAALARGERPWLVVPSRPQAEAAERRLLRRHGALLGADVATFDDLFALVARRCREGAPVLSDVQRRLVLAEAIDAAALEALAPSARFPGFGAALADLADEASEAMVEPAALAARLAPRGGRMAEAAELPAAYQGRLGARGMRDRAGAHAHAAALLERRLEAWNGRPLVVLGFDDLSAAQARALVALAGRGADVAVALAHEPGRAVFEAVRGTV